MTRYIIAEPGHRADEVQALLRLGDVEKMRAGLFKISNACTKEVGPAERAERNAAQPLLDALGIDKLGKAAVLGAVNPRRTTLGLPRIEDLTATADLSEGLKDVGGEPVVQRVPKAQAAADLATLKTALAALTGAEFKERCGKIAGTISALAADPDSANGIKREALLKSALDLYDDEHCPVCDIVYGTPRGEAGPPRRCFEAAQGDRRRDRAVARHNPRRRVGYSLDHCLWTDVGAEA